jgi:hypothetical protein
VANDIDGDGINDYFVAAPYLDVNGENVGRVYLLSGRTADVIRRFSSPEPQAGAAFGFFISAYGDADGDRKTDIAIGTDAQDEGGNDGQGKAWAFSGADGTLLFEMWTTRSRSRTHGSDRGSAGPGTSPATGSPRSSSGPPTMTSRLAAAWARGGTNPDGTKQPPVPRSASITFSRASSRVRPWLLAPGTSGTEETMKPSSPCS